MKTPRVTLVNPPATYAQQIPQKCFPPMGLLYLAASLESAGAQVDVMDANAAGLSHDACAKRVEAFAPDLVGMPIYAETAESCARCLATIRNRCPHIPIVAGGPQATVSPSWVFREIPSVDFVLAGEAERSIVSLARAIVDDALRCTTIPGLWTRSSTTCLPVENINKLDSLPLPARHRLEDLYARHRYYALLVADRHIDCLITSRGCPHQCKFCSNATNRIRYRGIDACLDELERLRSRGVRTVEILDDNFTASEARAFELLDRIRLQRFGLALRIKSRADAVTEKLMAACRRAGVYQVSLGAESGSASLLKAMNKRITPAQSVGAVRLILDEGMACHTSWIVGYPGETRQTIAQTADLIIELKPTTAGVSILIPYPGTDVYEQAKRQGTLEGDWSASSSEVPWIRLPWTNGREDLVAAKRALMRRVYFRPHYVAEFGKRIVREANVTLARYAVQELKRSLTIGISSFACKAWR